MVLTKMLSTVFSAAWALTGESCAVEVSLRLPVFATSAVNVSLQVLQVSFPQKGVREGPEPSGPGRAGPGLLPTARHSLAIEGVTAGLKCCRPCRG